MADLTTAQRLAEYRHELREAGFNEVDIARLIETAAPAMIEDIRVQSDLDASEAAQR